MEEQATGRANYIYIRPKIHRGLERIVMLWGKCFEIKVTDFFLPFFGIFGGFNFWLRNVDKNDSLYFLHTEIAKHF